MPAFTEYERRITGGEGCLVISDAVTHTDLSALGFVVNADAVVTSMTTQEDVADGSDVDATAAVTFGLTGVTLKAGIFIPVGFNKKITQIELTSGSVVLYNITSQ